MATPLPGDVLLCYAPSLIGAAIDEVEALGLLREYKKPPPHRPLYSHAALYLGDNQITEAIGRGLVKSGADKYTGVADIWSRDLSYAQRETIVQRAKAMARVGYRYNYLDIAVQFVYLTTGLMLPADFDHSIICSVAVYDEWQAIKVPVARHRNCAPESLATFGALEWRGIFAG